MRLKNTFGFGPPMVRLLPLATACVLAAAILAGCAANDSTLPTVTPPVAAVGALDCSFSNWAEPCLVHASPNNATSKAEVDLAVNPSNPSNIVVASKDKDPLASKVATSGQPCVWAVLQTTKDAGKTWSTTYVGKALADRLPQDALYGWECITDPILQFEADGTLHYSLQAYNYRPVSDPTCALPGTQVPVVGGVGGCTAPEAGFMFHAVSHDGGSTFPEILLLLPGDQTVLFHDYMRMGHNPQTGTVFTIWNQLTNAVAVGASVPVLVAVEHGATQARAPYYFGYTDGALANPDPRSQFVSLGESGIVGARDGTVYAFLSGFNSGGQAVLATSTDDGLTFSVPKQVFAFQAMDGLEDHPCTDCPVYPVGFCNQPWQADGAKGPREYHPCYRFGTSVELAVDNSGGGHDGCLYAAWGGNEQGAVNGSDLYVRSSCDKGQSWGEPVLVNHAHREDAQWMPRITVDGAGNVHIVYFTRAYDPEHNFVDAEWSVSQDGGKTWQATRLTTKSFDANLGIHQDGFPFIGDYIGIDSRGKDVWMGFPTTLTGRAEIAVAHATMP